jgi:hypothetical protein
LPQDHSTGATEVDPRIAAVTRKFEQLDTLNTVREAVQLLPQGARVLVVSKGDEALVNLDGWDGWHFPLGEDGGYAGYYPADSADAIEHLETLRAQGAQYLLFPRTSFWWLEHYPEFRAHLEQTYDAALEQDRNFLMITLSTSRDRVAPSSPETRSIEAGKRFG